MGLAGLEPCEGIGADVAIVCGAIGAEPVATASVHDLDEIARIYINLLLVPGGIGSTSYPWTEPDDCISFFSDTPNEVGEVNWLDDENSTGCDEVRADEE